MGSAGSPYRTADVAQSPPPPKRWYARTFGPYGVFNVPVGLAFGAAIGTVARHAGNLGWLVCLVGSPLILLFFYRRASEKPDDGALSRWILVRRLWSES